MTPAQLEAIRKDLGLDGPPYVRYVRWIGLQPIISAVTGEKAVDGRPPGQPRLHAVDPAARSRRRSLRASARRCCS